MIVALLAGVLALLPAEEVLHTIAGDAEYARRGENARGGMADPAHIEAALVHYRAALAEDPASILARARLMRALFFRAAFCPASGEVRLRLLEEARATGDAAIGRLEPGPAAPDRIARLKATPNAIDLYFWGAASWGEWALARGKLAAVHQGAAARTRDLAATVRDIDPAFEEGGGDRILGRLHDQTPRIPLLTGWVSHRAAIEHLERALARGPVNSVNRVFLAEALLDHAPERKAEARRLLEACVATPPRPEYAVEDARYAEIARARLLTLR
jgi:hypothetical protein